MESPRDVPLLSADLLCHQSCAGVLGVPVTILHGDCIEVMRTLQADSVDALVSDPPYGIGFMGREWDTFKPEAVKTAAHMKQRKDPALLANQNVRGRKRSPAMSPSQVEYDYSVTGLRAFQAWTELWAREAFRILKPGAHAVVCGAPRAYHRMASGLEDAGFEIRDCLAWLFGSGFPKSLNLGEGLGTALKPAHEPIVLARKPFKGTVKGNVEKFGTGALNIDACRIEGTDNTTKAERFAGDRPRDQYRTGTSGPSIPTDVGRWPANVCLDEIAALVLDEQSGELVSGYKAAGTYMNGRSGGIMGKHVQREQDEIPGDVGGASRFYYVAKPSREERDYGLWEVSPRSGGAATGREDGSAGLCSPRAGAGRGGTARNFHPTVKPVELMRWLVKLITPINGTVLDPFLGSGTTGMACVYEQRSFIGIEREAEYLEIAEARIAAVAPLFAGEVSA